MISNRFGHVFDKPLASLAARIPLSPNQVTMLGLLVTAIAGGVIAFHPLLGGLLVITGGLFDVLDGVMARTTNRVSVFGAFLDSVLDRYSDAFLFIGTAAWYVRTDSPYHALLSLGCLVGAYATSYTRARAEGLSMDCRTGIMERGERVALLVIGLVSGWLVPVLWSIFLLSNLTALQRILHIRKLSGVESPVEEDEMSGFD